MPNSDVLHDAFGDLGVQDKGKYLTTLFIDDLAAIIKQSGEPNFEISQK